MKTSRFISLLLVITLSVFAMDAVAQCPMCKMAAESNLKDGGTMGAGLNTGILYMFMMPYLIVFTLGFIWYRSKRIYIDEDLPTPGVEL